MTESLRRQMGEAAVAAARAVHYVGAGTVEFIVEQPGGYERPDEMKFYFMEMNTRLQVEHPVTEAITGLDLVEWQLRVASGEPLPLAQEDLRIHGHAIEARICAENPDNQFLPATGQLAVYRKPACTSERFDLSGRRRVRVDDGVREGDAISPFYDSMVAKLIVHGDTREQALARLDEALAPRTSSACHQRAVPAPGGAHRVVCPGAAGHGTDPARAGAPVPAGACGPAAGRRRCRGPHLAARTRQRGRRPLQPPRRLALARADRATLCL
jgi:acetyl/propionyl-CoA carboxylase alpha subunit